QAEDGIRYLIVTGVQTCALPICPVRLIIAMFQRATPKDRASQCECRFVVLHASPTHFQRRLRTTQRQSRFTSWTITSRGYTRLRSEERRVGKEVQARWKPAHNRL